MQISTEIYLWQKTFAFWFIELGDIFFVCYNNFREVRICDFVLIRHTQKELIVKKKKLKVLEVLDCYYPKFDGPCLVITSYANSFLKDGVDAKVAVPYFPNYEDNQAFEVFRVKSIPSKEGYRCATPNGDSKLKKFMKENQFDIIHIHSPFTMCRWFAKYGKKHNIPTIYTFHTKYHEDFERTLKFKWEQRFMMRYIMRNINKVDYVWTVSDGAGDCLREYGFKKDIKVIRNGTDLVYPEDSKGLIKQVDDMYNLDPKDIVFLSVGRIVKNKKLQLVLNALKIVADKGLKFKYLIVGSGSYEEELKKQVKELRLEDYVVFTGKIMDRKLLSAHYLRANLFVFASTFDTASLAPIEAAALKLPSIMNAGCSTAEIITDNVNGYLVEESPEAWADKIVEIMSNKTKLKAMKEKTYEQVYRTWDSVADEIYANYEKIIKERRG